MTADEWSKVKQGFMVFVFEEAMKAHPDLLHEMGGHLYDELTK